MAAATIRADKQSSAHTEPPSGAAVAASASSTTLSTDDGAAAPDDPSNKHRSTTARNMPAIKFLSVLYRVPPGICCEPVKVEWVQSSELVKTPVYLYHFYGDGRDSPLKIATIK